MLISFIGRTDVLLPPTGHRSAYGGRKSASLFAFACVGPVCNSVRYIACRNFSFRRRGNGPVVRGHNVTALHMTGREFGFSLFYGSRGGSSVLPVFFSRVIRFLLNFHFFRRYKYNHPVLKRCIFAPRN